MPACTATFTLALVSAVAQGTVAQGTVDQGPVGQGSHGGFVDLWNGKDLTGWVNVNGAPGTWREQNGVLACSGEPICALRTERMHRR